MRITWVDNLKWIGIILIVLWHCYFPDHSLLISYLFSFHIILFFFLSGLMFHDKKHTLFWDFLKNKFQRLIIPYIFFNFFMFLFLKTKDLLLSENDFSTTFISFIEWIFYGSYLIIPDNWNYLFIPDNSNLTNTPTWFLVCLFMVSIIYFFINKYITNRIYRVIFLFIISILIYIESKYFYFRFPFSLEISLMATLFYWIWHAYKNEITYFVEKINYKYIFLIPFLIFFNIYFLNKININFSSNYYWENYFAFLLNWFLWCLSFIIIAKNIPKNKILDFLGQNSILILWFEGIKFLVLAIIIKFSFWYLIFEKSYWIWGIQLISTFLFLIPIIYIVNWKFACIIWNFKKK